MWSPDCISTAYYSLWTLPFYKKFSQVFPFNNNCLYDDCIKLVAKQKMAIKAFPEIPLDHVQFYVLQYKKDLMLLENI